MRIGVNTRLFLKGKLEGVGRFAYETLSRMVKNHPEVEFIFFFDRPYDASFIFASNVTPIVIKPAARHPFLYILWMEYLLPYYLKKYKIDVFFSPEGYGSLNTKVPTCITIHDLAFLHFPKHIDKLHSWHYKKYTPKYINKAKKIIAVSEFTKSDIIEQYKTPSEKISVVYNSANSLYSPIKIEEKFVVKQQYSDGKEYFLFTAAIHPRKNLLNLLKAFVKFKRRQKCAYKLIIVGRMAWKSEEIEKAKEHMPYKEDVLWLGYVEHSELVKITAAAYALVYPSKFEGFGIPIVEAMQCGVPVIVSNTSSMPEVAGDAGLLIDPDDVDDIADKMSIMYKNENLRQSLSQKALVQATHFSWEKSAHDLWEILKSCAV